MGTIKPSNHGIVVEHKESGMRFAVSDSNYNPDKHRKVRDLKPGESVLTYRPRRAGSLAGEPSGAGSPTPANDQSTDPGDSQPTLAETPQATAGDTASTETEGSSPEGTKGK